MIRWYFILPFFFVIQLIALEAVPLWGSSEAREAHIVWEIANKDHGILPTRAGIVPSKPPLFHWLAAFVSNLFNISSGLIAARLISLIAGIGFLFVSFKFGKLFGDKKALAPLIVISSWLFFNQSTDAKVDVLFSFFLSVPFYIGVAAITEKKFKTFPYLIFILSSVASILTKGPLGIGLVSFLIAIYILLINKISLLSFKQIVVLSFTFAVSILIAGVWYVLAMQEGGDSFVSRQIFFENLYRILGHEKMNSKPWWFYVPSLLRTIFPWSVITIFIFIVPKFKQKLSLPVKAGFIVSLAGVIALSIASGKRHSYPLMLLPIFSGALAAQLSGIYAGLSTQSKSKINIYVKTASKVFIVVSGFVLAFSLSYLDHNLTWFLYSLLLVVLLVKYKGLSNINRVALSYILFLVIISTAGFFIKEQRRNHDEIASAIRDKIKSNPVIILKDIYDESLDIVMYHLADKIIPASNIKENPSSICIVSGSFENFPALADTSDLLLSYQTPINFIAMPCSEIAGKPQTLQ